MTLEPGSRTGLPVVRTLVYVAVLYASFVHNVLWVPDGVYVSREGFRTGYVGYDSDLVMNRIGMARDGVDPLHPLYWWDYHHARGGFIYTSQFGPQGIVLGPLYQLFGGGDVEVFAGRAACGCALLTALLLALFLGSAARRIGTIAADIAMVLLASTPVLLPFATSLYWACFLLFAPFVATWLLYPCCVNSTARLGMLFTLLAGLVCLKCLCGYEYVSTVILSPVAAIVHHHFAIGDRIRRILLPSTMVFIVGVIGFAAAIGMHVAQLDHITGGDALSVIRERAAGNTIGNAFDTSVASTCAAPDPIFLPPELRARVRCVLNYFWLPAAATPTTWGPLRGFASLGFVVFVATSVGFVAWRSRQQHPEAAALAPAAIVGLLGAAAWHLLALTHTCIHMHLNPICYAVPFLPLAYVLLGWSVQQAAGRVPWLRYWAWFWLFASIAGNVWAETHREPEGDAAARVETALPGKPPFATPYEHMLGPVVTMREMPRALDTEAWFHCRLRPDFNGSGTPTTVLNGWVMAGPATDTRPMVRVVATAGAAVLPVEARYARIDLVERLSKGRTTSTFFAIAVPNSLIPPGEKLRLFAVIGPGFETVRELTIPAAR